MAGLCSRDAVKVASDPIEAAGAVARHGVYENEDFRRIRRQIRPSNDGTTIPFRTGTSFDDMKKNFNDVGNRDELVIERKV